MQRMDRVAWLVAGVSMSACVLAFGPLGGLEPPAGPIGETSPSLADLETKIDELAASTDLTGEWKTIFIAPRTDADQADAQLLVEGRVQVRRTTAFQGVMALFDGPGGTVDSDGVPLDASGAVHHNYNYNQGGSGASFLPTQLESEVVVEDGLYLSYYTFSPSSSVFQIEYRELAAQ